MTQDLDKGGVQRQTIKAQMGPSLGWVDAFIAYIQSVVAASADVERGTTLVMVNFDGAVTLQLPSTIPSIIAPVTYFKYPLTIVDIGGFANDVDKQITILPAAGETIMGLASIQITVSHGSYVLFPKDTGGWEWTI